MYGKPIAACGVLLAAGFGVVAWDMRTSRKQQDALQDGVELTLALARTLIGAPIEVRNEQDHIVIRGIVLRVDRHDVIVDTTRDDPDTEEKVVPPDKQVWPVQAGHRIIAL